MGEISGRDFRLADKALPPIKAGEARVFSANQSVTFKDEKTGEIAETVDYSARLEYAAVRNAFTPEVEKIFSVCPANGTEGDFSLIFPFITFTDETLPWFYGDTPFAALLTLKGEEILKRGEIKIGELFSKKEIGVYFPDRKEFPAVFAENEDDLCEFIDISADTFSKIFPSRKTAELLAHVRAENLSRATDKQCSTNGRFSAIIGNRLPPSNTLSYCCLVTDFGYFDAKIDEPAVRLVLLYCWSVRSVSGVDGSFAETLDGLSKNSGEIGRGRELGDVTLKRHITRTGEETYSIYHSPLTRENKENIPQLEKARTADGMIIYDSENGVFDESYAAAYQLGRMITLSKPEIAGKMLGLREKEKLSAHKAALKSADSGISVSDVAERLLEYRKKLEEEEKRE